MLQELHVHHLALIDTLYLDLSTQNTGLIVLTGETGAGKSVILQAINLLTGGRGSTTWIRSDNDQAAIEAIFRLKPESKESRALLAEHSLEDGPQCLIRRVLPRKGRSRLFVNDQNVTGKLAGELTAGLISVASQHDQQQLLNAKTHLDFLDTFGDLWGLRQQFQVLFRRWQHLSSQLRELQEKQADKDQQTAFLQYQLEEIRKVNPEPGEDELLLKEREQLKSSDALLRYVGGTCRHLAETVSGVLAEGRKNVAQAAALDASLAPLSERLESLGYEVEDLVGSFQAYLDDIPMDPSRLEVISARLAALKALQRKYGSTLEEVVAFTERAELQLAGLEDLDQQIARLDKKIEEVATEALLKATELTQARVEVGRRLSEGMQQELASLNFAQALFEVHVDRPEGLGMEGIQSTGRDTVEFFFSANPGEPPKPLVKIVSGGELSRLLLAMKCLLAQRDQVDTVLFDEVDAGIGGQAAEAVAEKIQELAGHHQVICISHLPQIAACADLHFKVEKQVEEGRTSTIIYKLEPEERIEELARMLGGKNPTEQTVALARELVERKAKKETYE